MDDLLLTGNLQYEILKVMQFLDLKFTIKNLNFAKYFLGLEITRSEEGLYVNQRKDILDFLQDTSLMGCKLVVTPLPKDSKFLQCRRGTHDRS